MGVIYNLIFLLIAVCYVPVYIVRRKFHKGFLRRLGFLPRAVRFDKPIWIHAVSLGEAMAVRELIRELRIRFPGRQCVISTVTATGNRIAARAAGEGDFVTYIPFDISFILKSVLRRVSPSIVVIAETELWPNLITVLYQMHIPTVIVNGRISDRSFRGYTVIKRLVGPVLQKVSAILAQTDLDAQRFLRLGAHPERVHITGNMKFDTQRTIDRMQDFSSVRRRLGLSESKILFVAGSTHPGEEDIAMRIFSTLRQRSYPLTMVLAPRHPERAGSVANSIQRHAFDPVRLSTVQFPRLQSFSKQTVFILDTVGELVEYYGAADLVFVGGSLVKKGGHNILEPASLGKPVLFGPHMDNFRDIADMFIVRRAAVMVKNETELLHEIMRLLGDVASASALGERAYTLIQENSGSTKRAADLIETLCTISS